MIFRQILLTSSIRNVWRTVRRICIFISGSLLVARVKFEPKSSSSHESSLSQVNKKSVFFFYFILISFDCDSFFHNVAPTDALNINSPRDIFPVKQSREFIPSVGNNLLNEINPIPCSSSSPINFPERF